MFLSIVKTSLENNLFSNGLISKVSFFKFTVSNTSLGSQKQNYKKKNQSMKTEERRQLWEEFINLYSQIFKLEEIFTLI